MDKLGGIAPHVIFEHAHWVIANINLHSDWRGCHIYVPEKIVKTRLLDHLTSNSLLNPFQSADTKFYSTETTLLFLHDHLSNAISMMQQVSCLCLLDLSAAFDTFDHSILLHRLSPGLHFLCFITMVHFISFIPRIYCRDSSPQFPFIPTYL